MFSEKKISFMMMMIFIVIITGCTKVNPAEDIYHHLEKAVSLEVVFEQQQEPLSKAEIEEYEIYDKILLLTEIEEIIELALEAKQLAALRYEMIEKERESIQSAYDEFSQIEPIIDSIEVDDLRIISDELVEAMDERYEKYMTLHNEYKDAIDLDLQLYELVGKEDLTIEELEVAHEKVNASYEKINNLKEEFNQFTVQYNDLKRQFYEIGELDVVYN
ncbi:YkyA family protein [Bacillaceae bacterium IKA-2]|nr:YkyA family protein [Bacillaceae bacterium IKA-2]